MRSQCLRRYTRALIFICGIVWTAAAQAHGDWDTARPDGHAPIGVMGDHTHKTGEWMASYRYKHMSMEGNRDGTERLSEAEVFALGFMMVPLKMSTDAHMFGLMYAPTDRLTFTGMLPYLDKTMDMRAMSGNRITTESQGVGDAKLSALYVLKESAAHHWHVNLGLSLPTGSTDETDDRDDNPSTADTKLPYPMQLGSGTVDVLPGITYLGQAQTWSWGGQAIASLRLSENANGYTLGDRLHITGWGAKRLSPSVSTSLRLEAQFWDDIDGIDPAMAMPNIKRGGGTRVDALVGLNYYARSGALKGHRLAIEAGAPAYQDLDGPQLESDYVVTVGWQYAY